MKVREADIPDVPQIADLARELHSMSVYSDVKPDVQTFKLTLARIMSMKYGIVIVAEDDSGALQGFLIGIAEELWFSRMRYASDLATYARSSAAGAGALLYRRFIKWAKQRPRVIEITLTRSSGIEDGGRWERMMGKLGMERTGALYTMRVV